MYYIKVTNKKELDLRLQIYGCLWYLSNKEFYYYSTLEKLITYKLLYIVKEETYSVSFWNRWYKEIKLFKAWDIVRFENSSEWNTYKIIDIDNEYIHYEYIKNNSKYKCKLKSIVDLELVDTDTQVTVSNTLQWDVHSVPLPSYAINGLESWTVTRDAKWNIISFNKYDPMEKLNTIRAKKFFDNEKNLTNI